MNALTMSTLGEVCRVAARACHSDLVVVLVDALERVGPTRDTELARLVGWSATRLRQVLLQCTQMIRVNAKRVVDFRTDAPTSYAALLTSLNTADMTPSCASSTIQAIRVLHSFTPPRRADHHFDLWS